MSPTIQAQFNDYARKFSKAQVLQSWKSSNEISKPEHITPTNLMETRGSPSKVTNRTAVTSMRNRDKRTEHGTPLDGFKKDKGHREFLERGHMVRSMNKELDKLRAIQRQK